MGIMGRARNVNYSVISRNRKCQCHPETHTSVLSLPDLVSAFLTTHPLVLLSLSRALLPLSMPEV